MVQLKRKVTLKEKSSPIPKNDTPILNNNDDKKGRTKVITIIVVIIAIPALWLLGYYLLSKDNDTKENKELVENAINVNISQNDDNDIQQESIAENSQTFETTKEKTISDNEITTPQTSNTNSITLSGTLEEKATAVIRGQFGNGNERKQKLGLQYAEIQEKVNEMYRNGSVK